MVRACWSKADAELRRIRGSRMSMIFQNPLSSLNPVFTIGNQVSHVIRIHQGKNKAGARPTGGGDL